MECLPVAELPEGKNWTYEIKLDGWRVEAVKTSGRVMLYSRRGKNLTAQFRSIAQVLEYLPDESVIDGEMVGLGTEERPTFNLLHNFHSEKSRIVYYAFDLPICHGNDLMYRPLSERRERLRSVIRVEGPVGISQASDMPLAEMIRFIQRHSLEGIVAKRGDSFYQPGKRAGDWSKHRFDRIQEFVIGGYVPSHSGIDSLVVGVYRGKQLHYSARVRAGFVSATRLEVFAAIMHLTATNCPFVNLPEKESGRWGHGLTAEKMKECVWLRPEAVAEIEFLEWTGEHHLRHTKFIRLRDDKDPRQVVRET